MTANVQSWLDIPSKNSPCAVIAEVAQSHDGSLGMAHAFIDAAANAGANAIKFQTHIADEESSPNEPWRTHFSPQDETRLDYWRRMEFSREQWQQLKQHADDVDIHFLSSPFSIKAVDMLQDIGVKVWKIASGEINNTPLLDRIIATENPIILSTGLSEFTEIAASAKYISAAGNPLALLQCTSQYPCTPENIGLNVIEQFREMFDCAVGLSDHSGTIFSGLAAATRNIQVLEIHIALSREMFGPDVIASITTDELKSLIAGVRYIETINQHPTDKSKVDAEAQNLRQIFMKSIFTTSSIEQGAIISAEHLTTKKPGTGFAANKLSHVIGKKARRDIAANTMLCEDDLE